MTRPPIVIRSQRGEPEGHILDLAGKTVAIAGRLEYLDRHSVGATIKDRGGTIGRSITRKTGCLLIGHDCAPLVDSGALWTRIAAADRAGVPCLSEFGFARALRDDTAPPSTDPGLAAVADGDGGRRPFSFDAIARTTRLAADTLRVLALADVIALDDDGGDFSAVAAARQAARLLGGGTTVAELIDGVRQLRRSHRQDASRPLASHRFDLDAEQRLALRLDGRLADADGQLRLDLDGGGVAAVDALMDAARAAEAAVDWPVAEDLYRRCVDLAPGDPIAPFNLGNVLRAVGRPREAALMFQVALARDRTFAPAWYNLAHLAEAAGAIDLARDRLERALDCDPAFADAAFNLARLHYAAGAYEQAMAEWRHYLHLDAESDWARKARHGIALCHQHLRQR